MKLTAPNESLRAMTDEIAESFNAAHSPSNRTLRHVIQAYHTVTQSIPDIAWTAVEFNAETSFRTVDGVETPAGIHSKSLRSDRFIVPRERAGLVRVSGRIVFNFNATGARWVGLYSNGALVRYLANQMALTGAGATIVQFTVEHVAEPLDELAIWVSQNSGGSLNIGSGSRDLQNEITIEFP
jgi:hypothetical protein